VGLLQEAALAYARRGWPVFRVWGAREGACDCGLPGVPEELRRDHAPGLDGRPKGSPGKHPISSQREATTDENIVRAWWGAYEPNIGLVAGERAGFWILDVDPRNLGHETLAKLVAKHGALPSTVTAVTGSGGLHFYFKWPAGERAWRRTVGPGLDVIRGDAPYAIAPPSRHVSGGTYLWAEGCGPGALALAEAPEWLLGLASGPAAPKPAVGGHGRPDDAPEFEAASPELLAYARQWLRSHGPATTGKRGNDHTYKVGATLLRGMALSWDEAWPLALEWNASCEPPWDEGELESLLLNGQKYGQGQVGELRTAFEVTHAMEAQHLQRMAESNAQAKEASRDELDGDAAHATSYVLTRRMRPEGVTLRRWRGSWYEWDPASGCYVEASEEQVNADIYKFGVGKRSEVNDLRHALVAVPGILIDRIEMPGWIDRAGGDPYDVAACPNGLLHLGTGALSSPTPSYFCTSCLGAEWLPEGPVPERWLGFLNELWPDDPQSIATLQEWFGYNLTPDTRQQKMLFLVGKKRSGKGTITRVLTSLLGRGSTAGPTLSALGSPFGLWPLIGKSAAIISDARLGARSDIAQIVERLLSISGEDELDVDRKFKEPWHGKLNSRITIVSNELPRLTDASGALTSRMLLLELTTSFLGREDTKLTEKLLLEMPAILRWAVEGWRRLRERGYFVLPDSSEGALTDLADLASPAGAWIRAHVVADPSAFLPVEKAYGEFRMWCGKQGIPEPSNVVFGRDLRAAVGCTRTQRTIDGRRVWGYAGLRLGEEVKA